MIIRAAVFDLDGLLIDSERWSWEAHNAVLTGIGLEPLTLHEVQLLVGLDSEPEWRQLLQLRTIPIDHGEYAGRQSEAFRAMRASTMGAMPGALALIQLLYINGIVLGVASNSHRRSVEEALSTLGVTDRFAAVVSIDDVSSGKPAPDVYQRALSVLGVQPWEAIAFEDSAVGVLAARSAGLFVVAVPNPITEALDFGAAQLLFPNLELATEWLLAEQRWTLCSN